MKKPVPFIILFAALIFLMSACDPVETPEPTTAVVEPTEAPAEPTAEPTAVPAEPTEAPVEPTEALEPTAEPTEATAEPAYAEEVVIGIGRNLYYGHSDWYLIHNSLQVWEPLIYPDENLNPQPFLATSWESNEDLTEWTIYLREGITFHDGTPLTAEVAVENLLGSHENYTPIATLDRIEAVDDLTVKIYLTSPTPALPSLLGNYQSAMLSPATHQQEDADIPVPIGTGPYKFVDYIDGEQIILERNEDYWGPLPATKRIIYRYIPDVTTRLQALQSGEIDAIADVGGLLPSQGEIIAGDEQLVLYTQDVVTSHYLFFNTDKAPFDNADLRRAVSMALDRDLLVNEAVYGYGVPSTGLLTHLAAEWAPESAEPLYNLEEAQALAQGVLGDERVSVAFVISSSLANRWPYGEIAQIIQYELDALNIDVDIQTVEGGTWSEMLANDEYDMSMRPFTMSSGDPDGFMTYWARTDGIFNQNYSISYSDEQVEALIAQAISEVDPTTRKADYDEILGILGEQVPFTGIYDEQTLYATRDNVFGLSLDPLFKPSLATVYKLAD